MGDILDIQENLLDTSAALAELEHRLAEAGSEAPPSLVLMGRSLERRRQALETQFHAEANALGRDSCSYRMLPEQGRATIKGIASVLGTFVSLFSVVYDSVKTSSPKERGRIGPTTSSETAFEWGYSFSGSLGIVLTLPNQRLLPGFGQSHLDEAFQIIFEMAKAKTSADVRGYAGRLGTASVRAMYNWAHSHAEAGLGVGIEWRREHKVRASFSAPRPELDELQQIINLTSEETTEKIVQDGELLGADLAPRRFHMKLNGDQEIRGDFTDAITTQHRVLLPKRYKAHITKRSRVYYSTERVDTSYFLAQLEELS